MKTRALFWGSVLLLPLVLGAPARAADSNQMFREAIKLYEKGDYDRALKGFLKVMRMDPSRAEAREYMLRCSQKIVETKLGGQAATTVEKEIEAERRMQEVAPEAPPALSEDFLRPIKPEPEMPAVPVRAEGSAADAKKSAIDKDIQDAAAAVAPLNARDLMAERSALTDDLRRRYLGRGNVIDVFQGGGRLEVTFYMNRLFLPLSDVLKPEAFSILNEIRDIIRSDSRLKVSFTSVDNVSPAIRNTMADLSIRRTNVVFSYLMYAAYSAPR